MPEAFTPRIGDFMLPSLSASSPLLVASTRQFGKTIVRNVVEMADTPEAVLKRKRSHEWDTADDSPTQPVKKLATASNANSSNTDPV